MTARVRGIIIRGRTIELREDPGFEDGAEVKALPARKTWGEGVLRSAGILADDPGWEDIMDEVQRARKQERRPQMEADAPAGRPPAAGMLAHLPPEVDQELEAILRDRNNGVFRRLIVLAAFILAASGTGLPGERPARAQGDAASREGVKGSARTIEEVRGLVAELEASAERQRSQLRMTEASLRRARALLDELQGPRHRQDGLQAPQHGQQPVTSHSPEERRRLPAQADAEKTPWTWSEERATAEASARELGDGYAVRIKGGPLSSTLTLTRHGQMPHSWKGHAYTVLVLARDILYYADFNPQTTGCVVIAYDLKAGKPRWKTHLWGVPVAAHSQYRNRINLEIDERHLIVYGNESFGRYIELLDLETGKTVGQRLLGRPNGADESGARPPRAGDLRRGRRDVVERPQ